VQNGKRTILWSLAFAMPLVVVSYMEPIVVAFMEVPEWRLWVPGNFDPNSYPNPNPGYFAVAGTKAAPWLGVAMLVGAALRYIF
jgi:hypothetical protein